MCRLYAQISPSPSSARDFLVDAERSLFRQSNFRRRDYQKDGWGLGWYDARGARIVKSPRPIFDEERRFRALAARTRSRIVIGHLRAASNPMRLTRRQLMRAENAQPFTDGRFVFAHNGTVLIPRDVRRFLGPYRDRLEGSNDSEIYFWQFRKFFDLYGDVPRALQACVEEQWLLWDYRRSRRAKETAPYRGLNTLVSDGTSLHALCLFPPKHPKPSLFNPRVQWGRMSFARRDGRVIFASEQLDHGDWSLFRNPEIISATPTKGGISISRRAFAVRSR
jgi:predicted glutamine amidotransferase